MIDISPAGHLRVSYMLSQIIAMFSFVARLETPLLAQAAPGDLLVAGSHYFSSNHNEWMSGIVRVDQRTDNHIPFWPPGLFEYRGTQAIASLRDGTIAVAGRSKRDVPSGT